MRWMVFVALLLSGCAIKPVSTLHTYNNLQVKLSRSDADVYTLIDGYNKRISISTGANRILNFSIPNSANTSGCFYVLNKKGKNIFGKKSYFSLPLVIKYREIYTEKNNLENKQNKYKRVHKRYKDGYESAWKRLRANRAFKDNTCITPPQKPLPRKPYTKCGSENECREEGGAICFSRFLGTEGCGIALKELKIPGLLSAPGCAAAAAELANQKYNMDDAFVDFLHGVADDVADSLIQSESGWDQFWGIVAKSLNYGVKLNKAQQCTNRFVEHYYGPKRRWLNEINKIKNEPIVTRNRCIAIINEVNDFYEKINDSADNLSKVSRELSAINLKYEKLLNERKPISRCN